MANLTGVTLDKNVQESNGEFVVLPAGKYKACLVHDELLDNKAQTGKILKMRFQITEGQFASEILMEHLNITNPSQIAQQIGQGTLKRICNVCKVPYPPQDTTAIMGRPMTLTIAVEEFASNTTGKMLQSNKIKKYDNVSATPAVPVPPVPPVPSAPQAVPVPPVPSAPQAVPEQGAW